MQGRRSSAASVRTRRRAKARRSTRSSIPESCTSSPPRQASASMAPMRKEHDNQRVSNERLDALAYVDTYEDLALTRDDGGLLVLRFPTAGGPAEVTDQTHKDFPARLRRSRSTAGTRRGRLPGEATRSPTRSTGQASVRSSRRPSLGEDEGRGRDGAPASARAADPRCRGSSTRCDRAFRVSLVADIGTASERASYGDFPHPTFGLTGGDWEELVR